MEAKHTPWKVGPHPWPEQIGCCPLAGRPWSVHGTNHHNVAAAVSEDIARLIAAAPEMLGALKALMDLNDNGGPFGGEIYQDRVDRAWSTARAAIARATGGEG